MLIYIAWQLGVATNQQIGEKFGLTYSAVNQRVSVIKETLYKDKDLDRKYRHIKSLIKKHRKINRLDVLPVNTLDHITVSHTQFTENGIGLSVGNGYSGALTVFEGRSDGCGFQQLILKENYGFLGVSCIFGPCS